MRMTAVIAMLRAVNVGGHNKIKMDELRELCETLGFGEPRTFIQSGNVIFRSQEKSLIKLGEKLEAGIESRFGFRPDAILRTAASLESAAATNPFAARSELDPAKLLITFLKSDPGDEARRRVHAIKVDPEQLHAIGAEIYIHFPDGQGKSKLPAAAIQKAIGVPGTARNMNSVLKMLEMARAMNGR